MEMANLFSSSFVALANRLTGHLTGRGRSTVVIFKGDPQEGTILGKEFVKSAHPSTFGRVDNLQLHSIWPKEE